jgi:hypothetical protein
MEPFFLEGGIQHYFVPGILRDHVQPELGFRGGLGYDIKGFRVSVESGYTHIAGTNPLVLEITMLPVILKAGYMFPLFWGLGLKPELGLGVLFSNTGHYQTVLDMLLGERRDSDTRSLFSAFRLDLCYTFPGDFVSLYAGGGADVIWETGGPIPLPLVEAGISLKPFALIKKLPRRIAKAPEPVVPEAELPEIRFESLEENVVIEESPEQGRTVRLLNAVYFEADTAVLIELYRPILDAAGARLVAAPETRIMLRAYSAPFGTPEGQMAVSEARARFCRDYLEQRYGIEPERIQSEWYGAGRIPELGRGDGGTFISWESYRCVELIIEAEE